VRRDIKELEAKTTTQIELIHRDIKGLDLKITTQSNALSKDLKIWMGSVLTAGVLSMTALFAFFSHLATHVTK
jgi:hypothetical protein